MGVFTDYVDKIRHPDTGRRTTGGYALMERVVPLWLINHLLILLFVAKIPEPLKSSWSVHILSIAQSLARQSASCYASYGIAFTTCIDQKLPPYIPEIHGSPCSNQYWSWNGICSG